MTHLVQIERVRTHLDEVGDATVEDLDGVRAVVHVHVVELGVGLL